MGKRIPIWQILLVFAFMLGSLMFTILKVDGYIHNPLILSGAFAAVIAKLNGFSWSHLERGIINNITNSMQAILILLTVGLVVGTWIAGGIIQTMIYYGLKILNPNIFLIATVLICAVVSMATGSAYTTAGTVGIALIGIGGALEVSLSMTAGAVLTGAYFGDKMSPLSDSTNLAAAMAGSNLFDHIKHMLYSVVPTLIISLVIFGVLGAGMGKEDADLSTLVELTNGLYDNFYISPILLLPPLFIILLVAFKIPALPGLFAGSILGMICALVFQGADFGDLIGIVMYEGYAADTGIEFLDELLTRGGLESMFYSSILVICAMVIGGVLDASNMLSILCEKMLKLCKNTGTLVLTVVLTCILTNMLACDQYVSIVLPGKMFRKEFEDRRLKNKNLSRCLEDAGTVTSALIPWTTCGVYMSQTLGVPTLSYLPFYFLGLFNPIISIIYGFTGITMEKMSEEEYQEILKQREIEAALTA